MIKNNITSKLKAYFLNRENLKYLFFVLIATFFWLTLKLNERTSTEIPIRVAFNTPDGFSIVNEPDRAIYAIVDGNVIDVSQSKNSQITIQLSKENNQRIDYNYLKNAINNQVNKDLQIISLNPSLIDVILDKEYTVKVKVVPDYKLKASEGYILVGNPISSPDSVSIFGSQSLVSGIDFIKTKLIDIQSTTKDISVESLLESPDSALIVMPDKVNVSFWIDQMIEKEVKLDIQSYFGRNSTDIYSPNRILFKVNTPMRFYNDIDFSYFQYTLNETENPAYSVIRIIPNQNYLKNIRVENDTIFHKILEQE